MKTFFSYLRSYLIVFLFPLVSPVSAEIRLPAIFGDHMVLEQDMKIPVWGTADAGEAITVTLGEKLAKTTADEKGQWRVNLDPMATADQPLTLTVSGKNTLKFSDVLVGDVWLCSGQSNMEYNLGGINSFGGAANAATAVPAANDPQLRFFIVTKKIALNPEADVVGEWKVCTPDAAAAFSAVGYFFGQEIRRSQKRPIGLIGAYWGGKPAQAFTSLSGLQKDPPFANYVSSFQKVVANYPTAKDKYPAALEAFKVRLKNWNETEEVAFAPVYKKWKEAVAQARAEGKAVPPQPIPSIPKPTPPRAPDGGPKTPSVIYNAMIAPLIPYAIKGVVWYQGEANAINPGEYLTLFPRMITDWREKWGQGDFPFLFVQLAAFMAPQSQPSEVGSWAGLREAQLKTLSLPNTGMATAVDIGNGSDVHPKDKLDVGLRLALVAKHVAYGQDLVYSGPIYDSMKMEGGKIRLTFQHRGGGLKMGTPPWTASGIPTPTPTELIGFAIAGEDRNWVWAKAEIDGDSLVVSSDKVTSPVAVRYDWASNPSGNLYNKEGLPASPFRTDDWSDPTPPNPEVPLPPATK